MAVQIVQDARDQRFTVSAQPGDSPEAVVSKVKQQCQPNAIKSLTIVSNLSPAAWAAAIDALKVYLVSGLDLRVTSMPFGMSTLIVGAVPGSSPTQTIQDQMLQDAQRQQAQRWKILQETQKKIFEIQQDITVNRARTQDRQFKRWDEYIRS
jgi:hypothetical protein